MAVETKRLTLDFVVRAYSAQSPRIEILGRSGSAQPAPWSRDKAFTMRWYMSLQGECAPMQPPEEPRAAGQSESLPAQIVCRYEWAFGITLLEGFYWDWMDELPETDSLAVHVAVIPQPAESAPEPIPIAATLSTLHPSRNTQTLWEQALPLIPKVAAETAKTGAAVLPILNSFSPGLMAGSDLLASNTGNKKNWFLYQFLDEKLRCPVVEWRINKKVLREYGLLLRGSLYLAFARGPAAPAASARILLRPQLRYDPSDALNYIAPTRQFDAAEQTYLDVKLP